MKTTTTKETLLRNKKLKELYESTLKEITKPVRAEEKHYLICDEEIEWLSLFESLLTLLELDGYKLDYVNNSIKHCKKRLARMVDVTWK